MCGVRGTSADGGGSVEHNSVRRRSGCVRPRVQGRNDVGPSQDGARRSRVAFRPPIPPATVKLPLG